MEGIIPPEWRLTDRQKRILGYGSVGAAGLYFLYRAYKSDSLAALVELRERLSQGADAYGSGFALSGASTRLVMQDLHNFLTSDDEEMPQSLKQLLKLAKSKEFAEATANLAAAAAKGALGEPSPGGGEEGKSRISMLEQLMNSLTSDRGMDLVKLAVGVACRTSVEAYCNHAATATTSSQPNFWQQLLEFGATPEGGKLYSTCVGTFVREGTKVWMGSMEGVNPWEDFLGSLCKPDRQVAVDRITRSFVNELVVTFLKRSRHAPRTDGRGSKVAGAKQSGPTKSASQHSMAFEPLKEACLRTTADDALVEDGSQAGLGPSVAPAWAAAMVEAAKHPEIRGLILSVARTATAEGVRTSMFATRDMLLGGTVLLPTGGGGSSGAVDLQQQTNRTLGAIFLYIFMPMLFYLIGKRAALL